MRSLNLTDRKVRSKNERGEKRKKREYKINFVNFTVSTNTSDTNRLRFKTTFLVSLFLLTNYNNLITETTRRQIEEVDENYVK